MTTSNDIFDLLCCPVSKSPLNRLDRKRRDRVNREIASGNLLYVDGSPVTEPLDDGLITRDAKVIYAIRGGIPVLLPDQGIGTTQINDF